MPRLTEALAPHPLSLPAVLLLERDPNEAAFVYSLLYDVLKAHIWLWHEAELPAAVALLHTCRFRLILLDLTFAKQVSPRALVRRVQAVASSTPIVLRGWPEDLPATLDARLYGVAEVVPKGVGAPTIGAIRRLLPLDGQGAAPSSVRVRGIDT